MEDVQANYEQISPGKCVLVWCVQWMNPNSQTNVIQYLSKRRHRGFKVWKAESQLQYTICLI